jgi:hypothetical protein
MTKKVAIALAAGALISAALAPSVLVAAPAAPHALVAVSGVDVNRVSFFGWPFPYGYAYPPARCFRHVRVDTPEGWYWRTVFVCQKNGAGY